MKKLRTLAVTLTAIAASTMATMPAQAVISPTPSHQVSLAYVSFDNMQCTGTLVSPTAVLTARHCLNGGLGHVRLGADHFTAVRAVAHPQADLAVLHLDRPAPIAPSAISGRHTQPGNRFGVAGYGSTFTGIPMAAAATMQRRVTDVPSPDRQAVMIENHISQGVLRPGDSGGPPPRGQSRHRSTQHEQCIRPRRLVHPHRRTRRLDRGGSRNPRTGKRRQARSARRRHSLPDARAKPR